MIVVCKEIGWIPRGGSMVGFYDMDLATVCIYVPYQ